MKQNDSANNTPEKELLGIMNRLIYIILFMLVAIIVLPLIVFYRDDIEQFFYKENRLQIAILLLVHLSVPARCKAKREFLDQHQT
jgi:hypothetical protein